MPPGGGYATLGYGLIGGAVATHSKERFLTKPPDIFLHIQDRASVESCCLYLPLIMVISSRLSNKKY